MDVLSPVYETTGWADGFVSAEVAPGLAHTGATIGTGRGRHERLDQRNLLVKVPATGHGVPALEGMTAEGVSVNVYVLSCR